MGKEISDGTNIIDRLNWRYAVKQYDPQRKISEEDWAVLEGSLSLAPSSFGLQPYKFFVVDDPEVRRQIRDAAWGQPQITDASHLVVFAYKKTISDADIEHFIDLTSDIRHQERAALADYEVMLKGSAKKAVDGGYIETWNSRQAYIALGFLLETAAMIKVDATPMEGFDAEKVNEILGLTDHSAVVIAAVGYRNADADWLAPLKKVRKPDDEVIVHI